METDDRHLLTRTEQKELRRLATRITKSDSPASILPRWERIIKRSHLKRDALLDGGIMEMIQFVMRESYLEQTDDLKRFAEKVQHFNDRKKEIRAEIERTRQKTAKYVASLEEELETLGDDAQMVNLELQEMLQRMQQSVQMLSAISKTMHDTAMGIIRKIG